MELVQARDSDPIGHLEVARKALALPIEASRLHWHPFGVYTLPLGKKDGWSRRLHVWHPSGTPVGEASPYGVHTHSGQARSHVLTGTLHHHLYAFEADAEGIWQRACLGEPEGRATLLAHAWRPTEAGMTHTLPKDTPHGVTKPDGLAVSLFAQEDGPTEQPFTTWQRMDVPAEELVRQAPAPLETVRREAWSAIEARLHTLAQQSF